LEARVMTTNEGLEASGFGQPPGGGGFGQPPGGGGFGQPPGSGGFGQPPGGGGFGQPPGSGGFGPPPGGGGFGQPPAGGGFGPPPGGGGFGPPAGAEGNPYAAGKAKAPAITLIIINVIGVLFALLGIAINGYTLATGEVLGGGGYGGGYGGSYGGGFSNDLQTNAAVSVAQGVFGLFCGAFIIFGLVRMMQGRSWGLALAAVIMNMLPCTGPCCCLGLFVGIWGLIVLFDSEVKASFT
jgi:hypothetical protein